jgi:hypothetical protein
MRTLILAALYVLVVTACGTLPSPETVRDASEGADQICMLAPVLPASPERDKLTTLCASHADAKEIAEAYAQCPR